MLSQVRNGSGLGPSGEEPTGEDCLLAIGRHILLPVMEETSSNLASTELRLKIEKLELEIQQLKRANEWTRNWGRILPTLSALVPLMALLFAVQQFVQQQKASEKANTANSERAFMQPILNRQMNTYFDASAVAATLASSDDPKEREKAAEMFWKLYYGPLVMLESPEVSGAMKDFGHCVKPQGSCTPERMANLSLALASTLQSDLFASWKLNPEKYAERSINYAELRKKN
jgi:hypothetical protein